MASKQSLYLLWVISIGDEGLAVDDSFGIKVTRCLKSTAMRKWYGSGQQKPVGKNIDNVVTIVLFLERIAP
jgi:hypothetical protein